MPHPAPRFVASLLAGTVRPHVGAVAMPMARGTHRCYSLNSWPTSRS